MQGFSVRSSLIAVSWECLGVLKGLQMMNITTAIRGLTFNNSRSGPTPRQSVTNMQATHMATRWQS